MDGFAANHPGSDTFFGWGKQCSGVEVPEEGVDFYDAKDVPRGSSANSRRQDVYPRPFSLSAQT